jgi:histidine decarboxylase
MMFRSPLFSVIRRSEHRMLRLSTVVDRCCCKNTRIVTSTSNPTPFIIRHFSSSSFASTAAMASHHDDVDDDDDDDDVGRDNDNSNNNNSNAVHELMFSRNKAGSPSPWAVFDAWGAATTEIQDNLVSPADQAKLTPEAVRIPIVKTTKTTTTTSNSMTSTTSTTPVATTTTPSVYSETEILQAYDKFLQQRSTVHFGYPYNLMYDHSELYSFMKYSINNLGDPFVPSNYGIHSRQFECSVIDFFAQLWNMQPDSYWGYVTTSGTEGNLHGILLARECHPDAILYTSNETHYSIFKAARYYRMDCNAIPTLPMGEINYDLLAQELDRNRHVPAIINVNIGTTVKGAVDDLDRIIQILHELDIPRERYHIHCDGALFALMMPFIDNAPKIDFQTKPIDSIAVSGHKMLGCPMPCGVALCRKEHVKKVEQHIDYLNSVDTTIMGSRNGQAALYMWYSLRKKGIDGIQRDVIHCIDTARYLRDKLSDASFVCRLNDLSSTVVLERPVDDNFVKRWQLACEEDIAHVVVMPNVTREKIDQFVKELCESSERHGRMEPLHPNSSLVTLRTSSWEHQPDLV